MKLIKPSNFKLSDSEGNGWKRKTTPEYDISIGRHTHTHKGREDCSAEATHFNDFHYNLNKTAHRL